MRREGDDEAWLEELGSFIVSPDRGVDLVLGELSLGRRALLGRSPLERFTYDLGEVYL